MLLSCDLFFIKSLFAITYLDPSILSVKKLSFRICLMQLGLRRIEKRFIQSTRSLIRSYQNCRLLSLSPLSTLSRNCNTGGIILAQYQENRFSPNHFRRFLSISLFFICRWLTYHRSNEENNDARDRSQAKEMKKYYTLLKRMTSLTGKVSTPSVTYH